MHEYAYAYIIVYTNIHYDLCNLLEEHNDININDFHRDQFISNVIHVQISRAEKICHCNSGGK